MHNFYTQPLKPNVQDITYPIHIDRIVMSTIAFDFSALTCIFPNPYFPSYFIHRDPY